MCSKRSLTLSLPKGERDYLCIFGQGIIQGVFEISNRFWTNKNRHPNFDKLTKNEVFTKPLISKHGANH